MKDQHKTLIKEEGQQKVLKLINPFMALLFFIQISSGALAEILPRRTFGILHSGCGALLTLLVFGHVLLHTNWIKTQYNRTFKLGRYSAQ